MIPPLSWAKFPERAYGVVDETPERVQTDEILQAHGWRPYNLSDRVKIQHENAEGPAAHLLYVRDGSPYEFELHGFDQHRLWAPLIMYRNDLVASGGTGRRTRVALIYEPVPALHDILAHVH